MPTCERNLLTLLLGWWGREPGLFLIRSWNRSVIFLWGGRGHMADIAGLDVLAILADEDNLTDEAYMADIFQLEFMEIDQDYSSVEVANNTI